MSGSGTRDHDTHRTSVATICGMFAALVLIACADVDDATAGPGVLVTASELPTLVVGDTARVVLTRARALLAARWASTDTAIASVDAGGLVTALRVGHATIVGTSLEGHSSATSVSVVPVVSP